MERLVARFRAGKLWTLPGRVVGVKVDEVGPAERVKLERIWPRESAWLVVMGGWKVAAVTGQLEAILATPEMIELLIAAPAARRMLQPFCRALGVPMHLLWPGTFPVAKVVRVPVKRVRAKRQTVAEWVGGRIALPRGVLAWAKREGFGKIPRGSA